MQSGYEIKILLVDDNQRNLLALEAALSRPEYHIYKCHSGREAIALSRKHEFALALIDVQMPSIDGFETTRMIHEAQGARRIPIILVTANIPDPQLIRTGYSVGAVDFLFKPFDLDILQFKVSTFVDLYRSKKQAGELEALRREQSARDQLFNTLETMTEGFASFDRNWKLTYANYQLERFTGMTRAQLVGKTLDELFTSKDRLKFMEHYLRILETGESDRFEETYEGKALLVHAYRTADQGIAIFYRDITDQKQTESAFRHSENRFRHIAEGMPTLVFTANPSGEVTYYNQRWYEYTGCDRHKSHSISWKDTLHPDDLESSVKDWMESVSTGRPLEREHRVRRGSDHMYRWHVVRAIPVKDENGKITEWLGTLNDIHDQKMAAEHLDELVKARTSELARSEEFLESLIENLPSMVFVKDAKDLRYVRFNKAGEELIGYSRAELIGKNDYDFFPKEEADFFTSKDRIVLSGHVIVDIPEEKIHTKKLGERILHTRKIPVFGADGLPRYLVGVSEDITEQKRAEEDRLRFVREQTANEERERATRHLEFLAEASTVLSSSLDYRKTLNSLAQISVPMLGDWCTVTMLREDRYSFERVSTSHARPEMMKWLDELSRYFPPNMDESSGVGSVIRTGKSVFASDVTDEVLQKAAQDQHHLSLMRKLGCGSCIVSPIRTRDKVLGAISFVFDSNNRRHTAEDLTLAEELGRRAGIAVENALLYEATQKAVLTRDNFLSVASHELKTPITSLKLHLQMTRRATKPENGTTPSAEKLAKVLDTSTAQVDRLTALVDDLLDVSRIGAGKLSYDFETVNLSEFVVEVVDRYAEHMRSTKCPVQVKVSGVVRAVCDRFRMEQVILNLLSNAAKYGEGKPVEVMVSQVGKRAVITVKDQGMGIPKEKLNKIFERFERAVSSNNISGLGLGLYISQEIVKAHKGLIEVESEFGKGSIFTIDFPCNLKSALSPTPELTV